MTSRSNKENYTEFSDRLREAVRYCGGVSALAHKIGVVEGTIRKWLAGASEPTRARLVAIAEAVGLNVQWLATGTGPMRQSDLMPTYDEVREGVIDFGPYLQRQGKSPVSTGEAHEDPVVNLILSVYSSAFLIQSLEVSPESLSIRFVRGDAMVPTLSDGDVVLIDGRDTKVGTQGIYGLMLEGKEPPIIGRVQRFPGGLYKVIYDNPAYQPFEFHQQDDVTIIGRVIWASRRL